METNDTLQVDVDKVLADKNPGLARLLPRFVKAYLKKIVHQDEVNYVLRSFSHQPPVGFVRSTLDYMEITVPWASNAFPSTGATFSPRTIPSAAWTA